MKHHPRPIQHPHPTYAEQHSVQEADEVGTKVFWHIVLAAVPVAVAVFAGAILIAVVGLPDSAWLPAALIFTAVMAAIGMPAWIASTLDSAADLREDAEAAAADGGAGGGGNPLGAIAGGGDPSGALLDAINAKWGSVADFKTEFKQAALTQFGSGWAWLVKDANGLDIMKTANADLPMKHGKTALLTCDVWEHAYYIDYRNARGGYVDAFMDNLLNWDFVAANFG